MGASESVLSGSLSSSADQITTISKRSETVDPILEKLKSLKITSPILTTPPTEGSLTDILVRKPSSSSAQAVVNPKVLAELFSTYRDYQEEKAQEISKKQEEMENKIEVADALAVKLLQRLNHSVSTMKTTSQHLSEGNSIFSILIQSAETIANHFEESDDSSYKSQLISTMHAVHTLQVELGDLKGRLTEVLNNCNALCKRIAAEGPEPLRSSIKPPFAVATANCSSSSDQRVIPTNQSSTSIEDKLELHSSVHN
ncbi:hypothetical protein V6N13_044093 [Hibiscus sabdariffa]|uniref:Uncharacterized protein n=1 Tax=Hibiscus sabdariffa TaxID=183260 RepID=A0ABR2RHI9_9ROSI